LIKRPCEQPRVFATVLRRLIRRVRQDREGLAQLLDLALDLIHDGDKDLVVAGLQNVQRKPKSREIAPLAEGMMRLDGTKRSN